MRLKIKYMEIVLIKRETTGIAPNYIHENSNITKFEIMDGAPVKGTLWMSLIGTRVTRRSWIIFIILNERIVKFRARISFWCLGNVIPVRLLLGALPLTPTYKASNNKFSVKYALNMVLVDEEERRYFKQTEYDPKWMGL